MIMVSKFSKTHSVVTALRRSAMFAVTYRLPVYLVMFLLIVAPLGYGYAFAHPEIIFVALCFTSLMAFIYLLNKVTDKVEDAINVRGGPIGERAARPTFIVAMACLWVPFLYLVFVPQYVPLYAIVAVLGFFYSYPLPFFKKKFRLKQILFIKNTTSAFIWSLPPVGVQLIMLGKTLSDPMALKNYLIFFCVCFAFESLWDIRDVAGDKVAGVRTIANTFGVRTVQITSTTLLIIYSFLVLSHNSSPLFFISGAALALIFIWTASPKQGAWFYYSTLLAGAAFLFLLGFAR